MQQIVLFNIITICSRYDTLDDDRVIQRYR